MTTTIWLTAHEETTNTSKASSITVLQSPLTELTAVLHIITNPSHHGPLVGQVESFKNNLSPQILRNIERYSIMWRRSRARILFPLTANAGDTLQSEIGAIEKQPINRFIQCVLLVLDRERRSSSGDIPLLNDDEFRTKLLAHVRGRGAASLSLVESLISDPMALRDELINVIADVGKVFSTEIWSHISQVISVHTQSCIDRLRAYGSTALLSSLPSAIVEDKYIQFKRTKIDEIQLGENPMLLIPSVFTWPHFQVKTDSGYLPVVQYPIREYSYTAGGEAASGDVQRRIVALSDGVRFDICRFLARSPASTTQLAERFGIAASHVSRHLKVLLQAGLVSRMQSGKFAIYDFNNSAIVDLGPELLAEFLR